MRRTSEPRRRPLSSVERVSGASLPARDAKAEQNRHALKSVDRSNRAVDSALPPQETGCARGRRRPSLAAVFLSSPRRPRICRLVIHNASATQAELANGPDAGRRGGAQGACAASGGQSVRRGRRGSGGAGSVMARSVRRCLAWTNARPALTPQICSSRLRCRSTARTRRAVPRNTSWPRR